MKIVSLNTWHAAMADNLREFIAAEMADTDVFCLQEMYDMSARRLCDELLLADFESVRAEKELGDSDFAQMHYWRKNLLANSSEPLLKNTTAGLALVLCLNVDNQDIYICSIHGSPHPGDKLDTPARLEQSSTIIDYFRNIKEPKVILGDFNLMPETEQVHIGTVNQRFIASVLLRQPVKDGIKIIKILERRAGSSDLLGLDSIDFIIKDLQQSYQTLRKAGASVIEESNDMHNWLSLRFGAQKYEAKLVDYVVLQVAVKELQAAIKDLAVARQ
ncbi:MAG: endonuclease/exonuclease/phosphatase family protein [Candidatus Saccharimonadales bacterium]